ncbi:MAG: hypothetical protein K9J74_03345 [Sulfuritalea sp.]|nr:hypothetical protein [Sulfuritalea sp.]
MDDETQDQEQEEIEQPPTQTANLKTKLSAVVLRVLDGGLAALQKLRARIAPPAEEGESDEDERRPRRPDHDETEPAAAAVAGKKSFTRRALTVLMLLLLGVAVGTVISHRMFSKQLDGKTKVIEYMQVEVDETRKDELRSQKFRDEQQRQIGEYRRQLREMQVMVEEYENDIEDYKIAIEEMSKRPGAVRRASSRTPTRGPGVGPSARASGAGAGNPMKAGSCVTGTANLNENLLSCIEAFNGK